MLGFKSDIRVSLLFPLQIGLQLVFDRVAVQHDGSRAGELGEQLLLLQLGANRVDVFPRSGFLDDDVLRVHLDDASVPLADDPVDRVKIFVMSSP